MTQNSEKTTDLTISQETKGYTLDELRMQRAMALVKLEIHKASLQQKVGKVVEEQRSSGILSLFGFGGQGRMSTLGYITIGFKISKLIFSLWSTWHSKRR